jgi:hypothetical protein
MAYDYKAAMEAIERKKFSKLPNMERTPKAEPRKLVNSTLPAPSKPIAPKGKRGKRLEKGDRQARIDVMQRDAACVACELFGVPDVITRNGNDEWCHVHPRRTHKGVDVRQDPRYQVRMCPTHHDWHGSRGNHSLGIRVTVLETKYRHTFTVDGVIEDSKEYAV